MGYLRKAAGAALLGLLVPVAWAGAQRPGGILKALTGLDRAQIQIIQNKADVQQARKMLEKNILSAMERQSLEDRIGMYQEHIRAYRADEVAKVGYLRDHWVDLTTSERSRVDQAQADLAE